jgi:hypothetical protein
MPTDKKMTLERWSKLVISRDIFCQRCGTTKNLCAHHIKTKEEFPELKFELSNGICLCLSCHAKEHNLSSKGCNATRGIPRTKEVKEKIAAKQRGKTVSEEQRRHQSEAGKRRNARMTLEERRVQTEKARKESPFGDPEFSREMNKRRFKKGIS